jgi:Metallopeptidase family M24
VTAHPASSNRQQLLHAQPDGASEVPFPLEEYQQPHRRVRELLAAGPVVNVDVCGVLHRYHANLARSFSLGAPHPQVADTLERMAGALTLSPSWFGPG